MSATSRAASAPLRPITIPTSAARKAGLSLMPSPVMATTSPLDCKARTIRSLSAGVIRAKMCVRRASSVMVRSSASCSRSGSVTISGPVLARFRSRAIAIAVLAWSPVNIMTRTPARSNCDRTSSAPCRTGSIRPIRPAQQKRRLLLRSALAEGAWCCPSGSKA